MNLNNAICNTNGKGLWSRRVVPVTLTRCECHILEGYNDTFGELRVFFAKESWDTETNGLIYTDPLFLKELREVFKTKGFKSKEYRDVTYSEQGMQGDYYVSLDVGERFIKGWKRLE